MWNLQICMAYHLMVSDIWHLQNSASGGAKTSFSDQKWLCFQSRLLSVKDIEHWRPRKDASCKGACFTYQVLNYLINIGGHNWANHLAKTRTEPASSGFSWKSYSRNGLKMELFLILRMTAVNDLFRDLWFSHHAMQDSRCFNSRQLEKITHSEIVATKTSIKHACRKILPLNLLENPWSYLALAF